MAEDIGWILFHDLLGMTEYPGAPFTGNVINDLIMFLLVPSVFIIIVVYVLTGRMFRNNKIRLLLGITLYLFIIAGGYYTMFARLAGPYFVVLLVLIGLLYFFVEHIGWRREGGAGGGAAGGPAGRSEAAYGEALHKLPPRLQGLIVKPALNPRERNELVRYAEGLDKQIKDLRARYNEMVAKGAHGTGYIALELNKLEAERNLIEKAISGGV